MCRVTTAPIMKTTGTSYQRETMRKVTILAVVALAAGTVNIRIAAGPGRAVALASTVSAAPSFTNPAGLAGSASHPACSPTRIRAEAPVQMIRSSALRKDKE